MSDCVADPPVQSQAASDSPDSPDSPLKPFTSETGRAAANVRWAKEAETDALAEQMPAHLDAYTQKRLAYVREEIERLEGIASKAKDSQDVDRFSRAMERWIGIYCKLAGIPDPGSYRPAKPRGRQAAERITPE